jgi:hypothetical protein
MKRNLLSILALLVWTVANAQAATYYVAITGNDNNPGTQAQPFRTIAKGIAVVSNNDTILLANGIYYEHNLDGRHRSFNLRSESGSPTDCILDCQGLGGSLRLGGIWLGGDWYNISGLTIRNGVTSDSYSAGGISLAAGNGTISNCIFSNCKSTNAAEAAGADALFLYGAGGGDNNRLSLLQQWRGKFIRGAGWMAQSRLQNCTHDKRLRLHRKCIRWSGHHTRQNDLNGLQIR